MIGALLRWVRRRRVERAAKVRAEWVRMFGGGCAYCGYTRWANEEHGADLALKPHDCPEGNSPPHPLPPARVRR